VKYFGKRPQVAAQHMSAKSVVKKLDVSRAQERFGFEAQASFEDGLRRTIEWRLTNRHNMGMMPVCATSSGGKMLSVEEHQKGRSM